MQISIIDKNRDTSVRMLFRKHKNLNLDFFKKYFILKLSKVINSFADQSLYKSCKRNQTIGGN